MTLPANIARNLDALVTYVVDDERRGLSLPSCRASAARQEVEKAIAELAAQRDELVKATGGFVDAFDAYGAVDALFWGEGSWMTAMRDALQAALRPTASAQPEQPKPAGGAP